MRNKWLTIFFLLLVFVTNTQAQVWSLPKGKWYASLAFTPIAYDKGIDSSGNITDLPVAVEDKTIQLFTQYGVTDRLSLQLKIPYRLFSTEGDLALFNSYEGQYLETGKLQAFGNIEFGGFYEIVNDKPLLTASFFVEANTIESNYFTGLQSGYNAWSFRPGIATGWSFPKSWMSMYLGGDIKTNNYSSNVLATFEAGYKPVNYFYLAGEILLRKSIQNGEDCDCTNQYTYVYLNEQQYGAIGLKSGFIIHNWGLNLGLNGAFYARNLPVAAVPTIGVQYKNF